MPISADRDRNFVTGLSDFWSVFFADSSALRTYYDGVQLSLGQAYLEMLQATLGTSLKHLPLFSKYYYRLFVLRERDLTYAEGPAPEDDRYVFAPPGDTLEACPSLLNKVVAPTRILQDRVDYDVLTGALCFRRNLFAPAEPLFPLRSVQEVYASEYLDPGGRAWDVHGVKIGDQLRLRVGNAAPVSSRVAGMDAASLLLDADTPAYRADLATRTWTADVVRVPHDEAQTGVLLASHPVAVTPVLDAVPQAGTATVNTTAAALAWIGQYLYVADRSGDPANDSLFQVLSVVVGVSATLDRVAPFLAPSGDGTEAYLVDYGEDVGPTPTLSLGHTFVVPASLTLDAHRLYARTVRGVLYPAGATVLEGVDYVVDPVTGLLKVLSVWDPLAAAHATYRWRLLVGSFPSTFRGAWTAVTFYGVGDRVTSGGFAYGCTVAHTSGGSLDLTKFVAYPGPFAFGQAHAMREMPLWGVDVLVDRDALYNNFGYLLGFRKATSEAYRAFLRGVAQIFLLGPTLSRFESALNVMAGYPVIRDTGEVLTGYADGLDAGGTDGKFLDTAEGRDGVLDAGTSQFSSVTGDFFTSDVGAVLRVQDGPAYVSYVVTAVLSATTVQVTPTPPDATHVRWNATHNVFTRRFQVTTSSYAFTPDDVNGLILVAAASNARNVGAFRILSVENSTTVVLEAAYGFTDESGVTWALSRSHVRTVTTDRTTYEFPVQVPMRADLAAGSGLTFRAFEALTEAFLVEDYVSNPTWWHHVSIPQEILQLDADVGGRRRVTPQLIQHVYNALDQAVYGDFGLSFGEDDAGAPGLARDGEALWLGGASVIFQAEVRRGLSGAFTVAGATFADPQADFSPGDVGAPILLQVGFVSYPVTLTAILSPTSATVGGGPLPLVDVHDVAWRYAHKHAPKANTRDVGQHLVVRDGPFAGYFKVLAVGADGVTLTLDRFPPPEALGQVPPLYFLASLPPLLFRHTVAFVLMDRFLKYHALHVKIDKTTPLTAEFVAEITALLDDAVPTRVHVYLEPTTDFLDTLTLSESFLVAFGPYLTDRLWGLLSNAAFSPTGRVRYNDFYRFTEGTTAVPLVAGAHGVPFPSPPGAGVFRSYFVFGRFDLGFTMGSGKRPAEDVDYVFDYEAGLLTIPVGSGLNVGAGTANFHVVCVHMRTRGLLDPLDPYETGVVFNGADPTLRRAPLENVLTEGGLIDRAIQLNIS